MIFDVRVIDPGSGQHITLHVDAPDERAAGWTAIDRGYEVLTIGPSQSLPSIQPTPVEPVSEAEIEAASHLAEASRRLALMGWWMLFPPIYVFLLMIAGAGDGGSVLCMSVLFGLGAAVCHVFASLIGVAMKTWALSMLGLSSFAAICSVLLALGCVVAGHLFTLPMVGFCGAVLYLAIRCAMDSAQGFLILRRIGKAAGRGFQVTGINKE